VNESEEITIRPSDVAVIILPETAEEEEQLPSEEEDAE
jgi:hypothetical protein